jgi:ribosomal-protein-alanine N-acetyltransferase
MKAVRDIPVIETERLLLTIPDVRAAPRMLAYIEENSEHFGPWAPPEPPGYYTEKFWQDYLETSRRQFEQDMSVKFVFFFRDDKEQRVVGECNFSNFVRGPFQACYLGYKIAKRAEGQGLMREALEAAIGLYGRRLRARLSSGRRPVARPCLNFTDQHGIEARRC